MKRKYTKISLLAMLCALALVIAPGCSAVDEAVQSVAPRPTPESPIEIIALPQHSAVPQTQKTKAKTGASPLEYIKRENEWHASSDAFSVDIVEKHVKDSRIYVADVIVMDMAALSSAYAHDTFESKNKETPSDMSVRNNAVFAVNGDYYSYRSDGIIVRNGKVDRNRPSRDMLAFFSDGHMEILDEHKVDVDALLKRGLLHTFSFGPALVRDGKAIEDFTKSNIKNSNPRTGVGQIEPGHFVFVVVDGRQEDSHGMTLAEFAMLFKELGCELAYNLDGGASSAMIFNGEHINKPSGNLSVAAGSERLISEILFLADPAKL